MLITQNWIKYDKEISTNQLILKSSDLKNNLIRLNRLIFKMKLVKGHSSVFNILEGTPEEVIEEYKLYENNLKRLLIKNYPKDFTEVKSSEDLENYKRGRLIYSTKYIPEIHKFTIKNKLYYITLV